LEVDLCSLNEGVEVCCDVPSSDLYPPINLIQRGKNSTGFMVEYYVRPPVNLYFHLPVPCTLVELAADTELGKQATTLVSVAGSTSNCESCSRSCKRTRTESKGGEDQKSMDYEDLGRGSAVNGKVVFTNHMVSAGSGGHRLIDKSRKNTLKKLKCLRITILRTKESSVPCLRNLKILVRPNSKSDQMKLENLRKESKVCTSFNFFGGESSSQEIHASSHEKPVVIVGEESVPPEFLDEITQEILLVPMVLPSGKIVDRSTVDKCNEAQAVYGGLPRDPFSGTVYTSALKPLFNASLKSRIDAYLVQNNIQTNGQTVGDASTIQKFIQNQTNPLKRKLME